MGAVGGGDDDQLSDPRRKQRGEGQADTAAVGGADEGVHDRLIQRVQQHGQQTRLIVGGQGHGRVVMSWQVIERQHPQPVQIHRAARPDGAPIYVILDNLSANKTPAIRAWCARNKVELVLTPTSASWANPIEAQFGPLRTFTMSNSDHPNHTVLARKVQAYLRWRNTHARHPDVLAAQRRERARVRSEHQQRWGRPRPRPRAA